MRTKNDVITVEDVFSRDEIKQAQEKWNNTADKYNRWCSLGEDEKEQFILNLFYYCQGGQND